jgi:hypothetical protein
MLLRKFPRIIVLSALAQVLDVVAQTAPATTATATKEQAVQLSAFEVTTPKDIGYQSTEPTPKFRWVQDSFEDFSAGSLDAAGADLFVSRQGTIRTTHRFDLNGDGHLDLVFNSSHDERRAIQPTCVEVASGQRRARPLSLSTYGTSLRSSPT